jgi:hypothetical protein
VIRARLTALVLVHCGSVARADIMVEAGGGVGFGQFGGNERDEATGAVVGSASLAVGPWVTPGFAVAARLGVAGFLMEGAAAFPQLGAGVVGVPSPGWSLGGGASFVPNGPGAGFSIDLRVGFATSRTMSVVIVPQVFFVRNYIAISDGARDQYISLTAELVYRR